MQNRETICALSTPAGVGGIAVIRISGPETLEICNGLLFSRIGERVAERLRPNSVRFCNFGFGNEFVDEVVATYFEAPHSYTGEDVLEISCHGSVYVQKKILETVIARGARLAEPGEFTMRAFLSGKLDLSQAEAVADLIDSKSEMAHRLAVNQLRGGFSKRLSELRQKFVDISALLELELDFSDEDVEFADRNALIDTLQYIENEIDVLLKSFKSGNALKNGVPVAIIGKPNVGKSTLLNALLDEDRAIVSDTPGTTRDTIEDTAVFDGITFRFIDTAGIRNSCDEIENFGIERTFKAVEKAQIVLYMVDAANGDTDGTVREIEDFRKNEILADKTFFAVANKTDISTAENLSPEGVELLRISAKNKDGIHLIVNRLTSLFKEGLDNDGTMLTNLRHYEAMSKLKESVLCIRNGLNQGIAGDLVMVDIRQALYYIGLITGEVSTDEILGTIFGRFCIGK